jgi:hypothetical protein
MATEHKGTYVLQHICAVLSRRIHAVGADRRRCLPEQGLDLRHPVQGIGRDADHHRGHPKHLGARIGLTSVLHTWARRSPLIQMCNADRNAHDLSGLTLLVSPTAPCSPAATPSNKASYRVPASPSSRFPPLLEDFVRRPPRAPNRSQRPASEILHKRGGAGCVSRPSASTSIAGILLHYRELRVRANRRPCLFGGP